jgi:murein DD-endopeptidase MepM/ murein hydrolase activator NlpD
MSCNCEKPIRANLWTPIPPYKQPTPIMPGENIDCYMKRGGSESGLKNDVAEKIPGKIDNTSVTSDLNLKVDEQMKLTPGSEDPAVTWRIWVNGEPGIPSGMGLNFNTSNGKLDGTVAEAFANKNYKVLAKAFKADDTEIDSREFNFFPKKAGKDETVKFVWPYSVPAPKAIITSPFGPRNPPNTGNGTSGSRNHEGIDIAQAGRVLGDILSAADGTVIFAGPASGYGNCIRIEHKDSNGVLVATTVYGHMKASEIYVSVGQSVSAGQKIAKEGNEGHSGGPHLHFELHKGKLKNPVNPVPYLTGKIAEAQNCKGGQSGEPDLTTVTNKENKNVGMTSGETSGAPSKAGPVSSGGGAGGGNDCPSRLPNQAGDTAPQSESGANGIKTNRPPLGTEPAAVPISSNASKAAVQAKIQKALDEDPSLTDADKKHLMLVAKIESSFVPDAKNPTSSARGSYQMLDKTADAYYKKIGSEATVENRNDPYLATKAQIAFYKSEQKPAYDSFVASGGTKINGKTLSPETQAKYAGITQGEFTYGLIHHDGIGNAGNGKDLGGVDYYRTQIRKAG